MRDQKPLFPRRERKTQTFERTVNPAMPVSRFTPKAEEDGTILRWMAPSGGKVQDIQVYIEKFDAEWIKLQLDVESEEESFSRKFVITSNRPEPVQEAFDLKAGDRMTLRIIERKGIEEQEATLSGFWLSFLFQKEKEKGDVVTKQVRENEPEKLSEPA